MMSSALELYKQAVIFDLETTSLSKEAGILEGSLFDVGEQRLDIHYMEPNLSLIQSAQEAVDITRRTGQRGDIITKHPAIGSNSFWKDVYTVQVLQGRQGREGIVEGLRARGYDALARRIADEEIRAATAHQIPWEVTRDVLRGTDPFQAEAAERFWYVAGARRPRNEQIGLALKEKAAGLSLDMEKLVVSSFNTTVEDLLANEGVLARQLKQKALWIYNVNFEAGVLGGKAAALEAEVRETALRRGWDEAGIRKELERVHGLRGVINGASVISPNTPYVTGVGVNLARATARRTGDWSPVFKAVLEGTGRGDIRDIMDVVRAQQSYSQKMGFMVGKQPFALGADVQARLYAASIANETPLGISNALRMAESHISADDVTLTENLVLKQSLIQTEALEKVYSKTEEGRELVRMALEKRGPFYAAIKKAWLQNKFAKPLVEFSFKQRVAHAFETFSQNYIDKGAGEVWQTAYHKQETVKHVYPSGAVKDISVSYPKKKRFTKIDEALEHIAAQPEYTEADTKGIIGEIRAKYLKEGLLEETALGAEIKNKEMAERLLFTSKALYEESRQASTKIFDTAIIDPDLLGALKREVHPLAEGSMRYSSLLTETFKNKSMKMFGMFAAGITIAGAFVALTERRQQREGPETLRHMSYTDWLEAQGHMFGLTATHMQRDPRKPKEFQLQGLSRGGLGEKYRPQMTDFGSPYRGPEMSSYVFQHMQLMDARERYLRFAYSNTHYDPASEIGKYLSGNIYTDTDTSDVHPMSFATNVILNARASGINHNFFPGSDVEALGAPQLLGMRGQNLLQINLSTGKWKAEAEDADTIVVKRAGIYGGIQSFFGGNRGYSFRLAGIDSPETQHAGGAGYHREQPYAIAAQQAAAAMIGNARNLSIVVDPRNITYGRQVATAFADGRNLNLEFIRRGMAAFLPYKGADTEDMYNASAYKAAQTLAQKRGVGMWRTPFFQAYADISTTSGKSITFNTLTDLDKIAGNSSLMSVSALMSSAHDMGFYSNELSAEAVLIGERIKAMGGKRGKKWANAFAKDYVSSEWMEAHTFANRAPAPHKAYMDEMLVDIKDFTKTEGSRVKERFAQKNVARLNKTLVLDSMDSSTSVWSERRYHAYELYKAKNRRDIREYNMSQMQQEINNRVFNSPIGHYVM